MNLSLSEIGAASVVLFAVIDILGNIPVILDIKRKVGNINSLQATLVSLVILLGFLILGERLIRFIGIDMNSFAVAGSIVIFALALEMVLGIQIFRDESSTAKSASVVPIAFPMLAGAGSITSILSLRAEYHTINIAIAILLNMILVYITLRTSRRLERMLGTNGQVILKKIFGVVLLSIAVKLFSENAHALLK